ncbi:aminotransferase class V-fold PLP-dependent enzyme [soil metagenome]
MLRDHFPIFETKTYLNSCSKGALSIEVRAAYAQYLQDWETLGSPWELWVGKLEQTRDSFAKLVNAHPDEIAVVTSVSAAVSALASALDFHGERKRVVVSDFEFPTVAHVWHAQTPRGAQVVHVPEDSGEIGLKHYADRIDERTALVSLAHVCYRNGAMQDAQAVTELAHERGALALLDAYQSLGTMPIDVKALGVDILVGGSLKYLLGSAGLAFMYVREGLDLEPTATGWFAQDDIMALDIYAHAPSPSARRFESGTPPNPNLYAGLAGLELIHSVGTEAIAAHLRELTDALKKGAREQGFCVATPEQHGALVALKSSDVETLVAKLAEKGIVVSSRDGNLRVSPHLYNTLEDVARLTEGLAEHSDLLVSV